MDGSKGGRETQEREITTGAEDASHLEPLCMFFLHFLHFFPTKYLFTIRTTTMTTKTGPNDAQGTCFIPLQCAWRRPKWQRTTTNVAKGPNNSFYTVVWALGMSFFNIFFFCKLTNIYFCFFRVKMALEERRRKRGKEETSVEAWDPHLEHIWCNTLVDTNRSMLMWIRISNHEFVYIWS